MMLVFESLEVILLRTASDLSHFSTVGNVIVKKILSNYMKLLQGSFTSVNHRFVRQCLNLLTAMVSQGVEAAREVLSQVHFKALTGLEKRKDKNGRPDVRLAFIQFVLSFLVSGDSAIIGQVLEVKELLPHILSTGLKEERMSIVNLILSTLKTRVVLNKAISKTQKFLVGLKQATEDELVADLLVNVLKASPDVLSRYFKETQYSYTPRLKSAWQANVKLLKKIYEAQPEISLVFQSPKLTTVSMMSFLLKKASRNMDYLLDKSLWYKSDVYTVETMEELVQQYRETLGKILPDMTGIISTWQLLSKREKAGDGERKSKNEEPNEKAASKFSWFRIQDVSGTESSSGEKSVLYLLLKMFVLKDTGMFEYTLNELELWLDQLVRLEPNQQETVIRFLERVFARLVGSSYEYTDKVASFVQEAGNLQANLSSQDGEAASVPVSHIDDVLDMLDVIMEGSDDVLHCQRDPLPLCLTLLQYDKELVSSKPPASFHQSVLHLHQYYSRWLPQQCHEELFKSSELLPSEPPASTSCSSLLKAAYVQGPSTLLEDTFRLNIETSLSSMSLMEFPVVIKQILLYIKSTVENFGSFSKDVRGALLRTLMEVLRDVVTRLQSFEETPNSEVTPEKSQKESDLFLEINQSSTIEANKEQVLISALGSIFKHPCLVQWFLALERAEFPSHSLKPVALKHLCAQMTDNILTLLKMSAPTLHDLSHQELLDSYMGALERAALKELKEKRSQTPKTHSSTFQALLCLHSYMDASSLREVVSGLLLLPHDSLIHPSHEGKQSELSVYGHAALHILTKRNSTSSLDTGSFLTQAHLHGLGTLLVSCSSPELEAFLLQTLSSEPGSAKLIHTDVLLRYLQQPAPDTLAISALLLQNSSSHRLCFEVWSLEPTNMENMSQTEVFLPLINTYLQVASREDPARPKDVQREVLKALKLTLLTRLSGNILGTLTEDSGVQLAETLSSLIRLSADVNDIRELINNLPDALKNVDSFARWQLVDVIMEKLADCPEEQENWRRSVAAAALKCLIASYCHSKDQAAPPSDQEESILKRLQHLLTSAEDIKASDWNSFVTNGLRHRYNDPHFLETLSGLLDLMYGNREVQKGLIPLSTLHMMTSSHSQFLPMMLESSEESSRSRAKEALVSLLLCLVKKCPTVCSINHFVVLLAAYGATLSTSDQKLLLLLQEYERNQVSLLKFQSFLWGPAAVEHHKTQKSLGASLWKQPSSDDVLALLKTDMMQQTILKFPQRHRIFPQDDTELLYRNDAVDDLGCLYDPCFLLPLFSAILRPECVIDCLKFVSSQALGVTVVSLSSYDSKLRAAAYHVLHCFYQHLEAARFKEKRQLLYLMDIVKNAIRKQNQRLPFILTSYITKVAQQMLKPEDHMYVVLNRFLLSCQSLDLRKVPEFFKLFYGFELEHKMEREWILNVLEEGIMDGHCYDLCNQQGIFQVLLSFSSSPLCSERYQMQIIRVLCKAARVTKAAYDLSKSCGLLSWIIQLVEKRNLNQQLLSAVIDLLHVLWFTNLGQKEEKVEGDHASSSTQEKPQGSVKCLPLPLISEFLCVAKAICRHLRLGVKATQFSLFVQTLCSVLMHRGTALSVNKQADRLTLLPQPLSCSETLTLLLCWASLSCNTVLLAQIQALSEKYKFRELMGVGKYKVRGKGFVSQIGTRMVNPPENTETLEQEENLLAGCKLHLSGIFVHWEPVFHPSEPQSAQPRDELDPAQLANDTAHLLTKWSLRWLAEAPYDENRTKELLLWLEKVMVKPRRILKVVMQDLGLKADLLQLFHHSVEAQRLSSVETLQLFTNIMILLLETQGNLPEFHQGLISACLPEQDPSKHEAGLVLLSSYIHELWSGDSSAELFLSHVNLVTRTKSRRQKGSKSKSQTAIRAICNDIIAMKSSHLDT
uniref:URB1 ribosome biogenesis 1 homolog n=3 Tax=Iconisemion striatum TaxID=60296 RepID=A0A1A7XHS4_9TELE